ncbi:MAG: hypothetical protein A2X23_10215 [Chloroflexi bacterium GWC2_73_18]|nr:MAG: hypothetical protein A2X23_10215 [Chloroflexi bacterium GWC2_73_18]
MDDPSSWPAWYVAALAVFAAVLGGLAAYDARRRRIPNAVTYPAIAAAGALAFVSPAGPWWSFLLAGLFAGAALVLLALASRGGMGYGDAKLAALVGLLTGWPGILVALFVAAASGAAVGLALMTVGRARRGEPIPFAPALAAGAIVGLAAGGRLAHLLWPGLV